MTCTSQPNARDARAFVAAAVMLASFSAVAGPTLEQGIQRETALLVNERDALRRERERIDVEHDARAAALRKTIATLEAPVVEASAREEALRAAVQAHATVAPSSSASTMTASASMRAAWAALGGPAPTTMAGVDPVVASLPEAVRRLRERATPQTLATGFFDADGAWLEGHVTRWGAAAWAATTDPAGSAGPLVPAVAGARQLAPVDDRAVATARAIVAGEKPSLLPLVFASDSAAGEPGGVVVVAGFGERLSRLGLDGVLLFVVLIASFAVGCAALVRVLRAHRAVAVVAGRLPGLVRAGELAAAAALARTVPGVAGTFLQSVVAATMRAHPEDEVTALSAEAGFALERSNHVARVGAIASAAVVLLVAARSLSGAIEHLLGVDEVPVRAVLDALAGALLPVEVGALAAIPWALLLISSGAVVVRARERLEVVALRVLDATAQGQD